MWRNWTGDQSCEPAAIERPGSISDLQAVVGRAAERGQTVRACGSGHSFTDVACTDGVMIDLRPGMNRILDIDRSSGLAKVEAGINLHDLNNRLWDEQSLAIPNLGDIDVQSIAGAISTSTHGTGARVKTIADSVEAMEVVTAAGDVLEAAVGSDADLVRAFRVGLGSLGVIASLTLRAEPAFTLQRRDHSLPLDEALGHFDELADGNDHFEFFIFPHTEVALCRETKRVDGPPKPWSRAKAWWEETAVENHAMGLVSRASRRFPSRIPQINRRIAGMLGGSVKTDRSYRVYATVRNVRFTEMEYAIPRERVADALRGVLDMIPRRGHAVGFPIEARVLDGDDAMLSTAYGRQTVYIAVHMYEGMAWEPYFRDVEAIMDDCEGRPHWGKRHFQTAQTLAPRYPEWDRFQEIRARLDPNGLFANAYTDRVLGPVGVVVA
ncbi:MAG: D-arabinono-1,4-lactone oxidase [Solirubrobacterales bacterium]